MSVPYKYVPVFSCEEAKLSSSELTLAPPYPASTK